MNTLLYFSIDHLQVADKTVGEMILPTELEVKVTGGGQFPPENADYKLEYPETIEIGGEPVKPVYMEELARASSDNLSEHEARADSLCRRMERLTEWCRWEVLRGQLKFSDLDGKSHVVDYGVPNGRKPIASIPWSNENAAPAKDVRSWIEAADYESSLLVMQSRPFKRLLDDSSANSVKAFERQFGVSVAIYDAGMAYEGSTTENGIVHYVHDHELFILPKGMRLGRVAEMAITRPAGMRAPGPACSLDRDGHSNGIFVAARAARLPVLEKPEMVYHARFDEPSAA